MYTEKSATILHLKPFSNNIALHYHHHNPEEIKEDQRSWKIVDCRAVLTKKPKRVLQQSGSQHGRQAIHHTPAGPKPLWRA